PERTRRVKDYRNLTSGVEDFSADILLAIRRTERYLEVARDLEGQLHWDQQYEWIKFFTGKEESAFEEARQMRELLGSPQDGKINKRKTDEAFRYWRKKIEKNLNVFVF